MEHMYDGYTFDPLSSFKCSVVKRVFVPHYLYSTAEFGSRLTLVTMTIEVALGRGRRVCFRLRQTEKERSVTVINALAETETVDSQGPIVIIRVLRSTPVSHTQYLTSTRAGRSLIAII